MREPHWTLAGCSRSGPARQQLGRSTNLAISKKGSEKANRATKGHIPLKAACERSGASSICSIRSVCCFALPSFEGLQPLGLGDDHTPKGRRLSASKTLVVRRCILLSAIPRSPASWSCPSSASKDVNLAIGLLDEPNTRGAGNQHPASQLAVLRTMRCSRR